MSDMLTLARDYLERMSNPAYGFAVNEDYAIRFATMLASGEFESTLNREIAQLKRTDSLTSHGWLWLFGWAKGRTIRLPDTLLLELFREWASVFARTTIVDFATQNAVYDSEFGVHGVAGFPHPFLSQLMVTVTSTDEPERSERVRSDFEPERPRDEGPRSIALAEDALVAMLQVGRPVTVDAAALLLRHRWQEQTRLVEYFWLLTDSLDDETRETWMQRVHPPERRRG